jgi:hypothetical protein
LVAGAAALDRDVRIASYRTEHGVEVDFVVQLGRDPWALEVKASRRVEARDLRGLRSFGEFEGKRHKPLVLYLGDVPRRVEGIDVLPWQEGLREMGL